MSLYNDQVAQKMWTPDGPVLTPVQALDHPVRTLPLALESLWKNAPRCSGVQSCPSLDLPVRTMPIRPLCSSFVKWSGVQNLSTPDLPVSRSTLAPKTCTSVKCYVVSFHRAPDYPVRIIFLKPDCPMSTLFLDSEIDKFNSKFD